MSGETNLATLIESMTPVLTPKSYVFGTLERINYEQLEKLDPISTFQESEGLTVVLVKETADEHQISYSGVYRCITLNVHSSLDAVGLTAAVANKLTQNNISANVIAAYYHDHVFVSSNDAEQALSALNELVRDGL